MAKAFGEAIDLEYAYQNFKVKALKNCISKISELVDAKTTSNFEAEYRKRSFEKFRNEIQFVEGGPDLIKNLKILFYVASSGPENKIRRNLELTGLLPYVESKIFGCYTIKKWKPDPVVFYGLLKTGVSSLQNLSLLKILLLE